MVGVRGVGLGEDRNTVVVEVTGEGDEITSFDGLIIDGVPLSQVSTKDVGFEADALSGASVVVETDSVGIGLDDFVAVVPVNLDTVKFRNIGSVSGSHDGTELDVVVGGGGNDRARRIS